ncbi:MAG: hypothetical protein H6Q69_2384 [Firmicutes bacterium]|nr:hypothetical protein [Bacillota bacterium]MBP2659352.1 hypothetical protein [Bacillota bacterium]
MKVTTLLKILCCLCVIIWFSGLAYAKEKKRNIVVEKKLLNTYGFK